MLFLHMQKNNRDTVAAEKRELKVRILSEVMTKRQIVASEDPVTVSTPKEKAYLSEKDRAFDRQTKARTVDKFHQGMRMALQGQLR